MTSIPRYAAALSSLCLSLLAPQALAGSFPTVLSGNTTGQPDTVFLGPPDDAYRGLGADELTYDFGVQAVLNRAGAVDINVYEYDSSSAEFNAMTVLVSQDGVIFTSIKATEQPLVRTAGDNTSHTNNNFGRSYELGNLAWVRYVRIDGLGTGRAGGANGFDLDAIAAHEVMAVVPEPAAWLLMAAGLAAVGLQRRRTAGAGARR
jgi:hypothetical protein